MKKRSIFLGMFIMVMLLWACTVNAAVTITKGKVQNKYGFAPDFEKKYFYDLNGDGEEEYIFLKGDYIFINGKKMLMIEDMEMSMPRLCDINSNDKFTEIQDGDGNFYRYNGKALYKYINKSLGVGESISISPMTYYEVDGRNGLLLRGWLFGQHIKDKSFTCTGFFNIPIPCVIRKGKISLKNKVVSCDIMTCKAKTEIRIMESASKNNTKTKFKIKKGTKFFVTAVCITKDNIYLRVKDSISKKTGWLKPSNKIVINTGMY